VGIAGSTGCSAPKYVLEQGWGQLKVLHRRQRISDLLRRPDLRPQWRDKLQLVRLVRRYAHEEIGLRQTGAYTRFHDTGGKPLAYNLSACPKDSLKPKVWRFPIVGGLPYIGFFERKKGEQRQQELEREGLDTYLRPVSAFSSLGWFADPVYSSMLDDDPSRLVDLIIHETTHTTIFIRDQVAFNESLAVFVAHQGTLNFLARLYGPTSQEVKSFKAKVERRRRFSRLVSALYERLERLYDSDLPRRSKLERRELLFNWAQKRYKQIVPRSRWGSFAHRRLNNAVLLSYGRYNQGLDFHHRIYKLLGRDLKRLVELYARAQHFDDPIAYLVRVCGIQRFDEYVRQRM
jgi:predicted aminopeptidase